VNRVQNLRKEAGFEVMDHIKILTDLTEDKLKSVVKNQENYICTETLADKIVFADIDTTFVREVKIEDVVFKVGLKKRN
jgi:isoleucyl-tRNA synthetase